MYVECSLLTSAGWSAMHSRYFQLLVHLLSTNTRLPECMQRNCYQIRYAEPRPNAESTALCHDDQRMKAFLSYTRLITRPKSTTGRCFK